MLRIGANAHHDAMTADDFALIADRFDGWSDFHILSPVPELWIPG
jgi:hypothetical protein